MNYLIYILIIFAKTIEVTLTTFRISLITKGEQLKGAIIALFDVTLWIFLVSTVLKDVTNDPLKILAYAIGFSLGNYLGVIVEKKLALGTVRVEVIVKKEHGKDLANSLRALGYAVTVMCGDGMNFERNVLLLVIRRKNSNKIVETIKRFQPNAFIILTDTKPIYGGFGTLKK